MAKEPLFQPTGHPGILKANIPEEARQLAERAVIEPMKRTHNLNPGITTWAGMVAALARRTK